MSDVTTYEGPAEIYFGALLLVEATSVKLALAANNHKVVTMRKGLAGKSNGPREASIDLEEAEPRAGTEFDFEKAHENGDILTVTHRSGGVTRTLSMWIDDLSHASDTGNAPKWNMKLMGKVTSRR